MTAPVGASGYSGYQSHAIQDGTVLGDNGSLLSEPLGAHYDGIGALYVLMAQNSRLSGDRSMMDIDAANQERAAAWDEQLRALEAARESREEEGFWGKLAGSFGTVAKVAGCVAACALAVGSLGAATPLAALAIAGAVCSCASVAQSEFGAFDGFMSQEVADAWGLGLGIAGAACTLGAGAWSYFGKTGALAGEVSAVTKLGSGAAVVGGASGVAAGVSTYQLGQSQEQTLDHEADAAQAALYAQLQQFLLTQLVGELAETKERETSNVERIVGMNNLQDAALSAVAQGVA